MINNVVLVGRVADEPRFTIIDSGYKVANFTLAVRRETRDANNDHDCDFVQLSAWHSLSEIVRDYVHKGSVIGVRCRLGTRLQEIGGQKVNMIYIYAENVSFISMMPRPKDVPANQVFEDPEVPSELLDDCDSK